MESVFEYEDKLLQRLDNLQKHNSFLPHIGEKYNSMTPKILIVAESHYLPEEFNNIISVDDWYNNPKKVYESLNNKAKSWINTKEVIKHYQKEKIKTGGLSIFNNLEKSFRTIYKGINLFEVCAYINYFQRPAELKGETIKVRPMDSEVALKNLLVLIDVIKPDKVIFVSSKAYDDFKSNTTISVRNNLPFIGSVPHPSASSWWNRPSKKYGLNEKGEVANGREKFERIIKIKKEN